MSTNIEFDDAQKILMFFVMCVISILTQCTDTQPAGLATLTFIILIVAIAITPAIAIFSKKVFWIYWLLVGVGVFIITLKFFHVI